MGKRQVVVRGSATLGACVALLIMSQGVSEASPDVVGKTYGEAKGLLGQAGMTPVVATVLGDRASSQDDCYVSSVTSMTPLNSSGVAATSNQVQVNLNCYVGQSTSNAPGFSKANLSPDAVAIREARDEADKKWKASADGQQWCAKYEAEHPEYVPVAGCHPDDAG